MSVTEDPPRRGGRPLDPSRDAAIRQAALECLAEVGYERLTMDQVAARARAGKGALYRRWPSKAALIVDAVVCWHPDLTFAPTDSLRGDLDQFIETVADDHRDEPERRIGEGLIIAAASDPEFAQLLHDHFAQPRKQVLRHIIERAQARGEAEPDLDIDLIVDLLPAVFISRKLLGAEIPSQRELTARVIDNIIEPLVRLRG